MPSRAGQHVLTGSRGGAAKLAAIEAAVSGHDVAILVILGLLWLQIFDLNRGLLRYAMELAQEGRGRLIALRVVRLGPAQELVQLVVNHGSIAFMKKSYTHCSLLLAPFDHPMESILYFKFQAS